MTSTPATLPKPTKALPSGRSTRIPPRLASSSTARNPRLCGVHWYSGPGLPRPTMSRIDLSRAAANHPPQKANLLLLLLLLAAGFGAFLAFHFLLALLDDLGLGRHCAFCRHFGRLLFFRLERDDVSDDPLRVGDQLHLVGVDRDITGSEMHADHQVADVQLELGRNFAGQAFNFDVARDGFKDAALLLDARGLAEGVHRDLNAHSDVHRDAEEIHVEQVAGYRVNLPVLDDGRLLLAGDGDLEQGVVSGGGAENLPNLLGVYAEREGVPLGSIENGGNVAGY